MFPAGMLTDSSNRTKRQKIPTGAGLYPRQKGGCCRSLGGDERSCGLGPAGRKDFSKVTGSGTLKGGGAWGDSVRLPEQSPVD